jgi:hypothetical protein
MDAGREDDVAALRAAIEAGLLAVEVDARTVPQVPILREVEVEVPSSVPGVHAHRLR